MIDRIRNEPALLSGLVVVLLNLLAAFGLELNAEQTVAINAFVVAGLAVLVRSQVTPTRKLDESGAGELKLIVLVVLGVILAVVFVIPLLERTF